MRPRVALALLVALVVPRLAAGQPDGVAGPLAELDVLTGAWLAQGSGFETELTYRWLIEGHVLAGENDVRDAAGNVIARYRGAYAWDAGQSEIVFWTAAEGGEVHRGRAWWADGVLWHEAEVSGGQIEGYASAVRPEDARIEYFAAYEARTAGPELLEGEPLVYTRQ